MAAISDPERSWYSVVNGHKNQLEKLNLHGDNTFEEQGYRVDENIKDRMSRYDEVSGTTSDWLGCCAKVAFSLQRWMQN